jgi:hypothetical protein
MSYREAAEVDEDEDVDPEEAYEQDVLATRRRMLETARNLCDAAEDPSTERAVVPVLLSEARAMYRCAVFEGGDT